MRPPVLPKEHPKKRSTGSTFEGFWVYGLGFIPSLLLSVLLLLLLHGHIAQANRQVAGLNGCKAPEHEAYAEEVLR